MSGTKLKVKVCRIFLGDLKFKKNGYTFLLVAIATKCAIFGIFYHFLPFFLNLKGTVHKNCYGVTFKTLKYYQETLLGTVCQK